MGNIKRGSARITVIEISDEERKRWEAVLFDYYKESGEISGKREINSTIRKKLEECLKGWVRAPREFSKRVARKTGYNEKGFGKKKGWDKKLQKKIEKMESDNDIVDACGFDISSDLSKEEKVWWAKRKKIYMDEFEFNESSDYGLLQQLLVEELTQQKIAVRQLGAPLNLDYSKVSTENLKRLNDLQVKLGITRQQRADELEDMDGNIAKISVDLDKKMADISKIEAEELIEEQKMMEEKNEKPPINILPPREKVIATLGITEDGSSIAAIEKDLDISGEMEKLHFEEMVKKEKQPSIK